MHQIVECGAIPSQATFLSPTVHTMVKFVSSLLNLHEILAGSPNTTETSAISLSARVDRTVCVSFALCAQYLCM